MLTNAGGVVAAETVEEKLAPMFAKVGIKEGLFTMTFAEDGKINPVAVTAEGVEARPIK